MPQFGFVTLDPKHTKVSLNQLGEIAHESECQFCGTPLAPVACLLILLAERQVLTGACPARNASCWSRVQAFDDGPSGQHPGA